MSGLTLSTDLGAQSLGSVGAGETASYGCCGDSDTSALRGHQAGSRRDQAEELFNWNEHTRATVSLDCAGEGSARAWGGLRAALSAEITGQLWGVVPTASAHGTSWPLARNADARQWAARMGQGVWYCLTAFVRITRLRRILGGLL